MTLATRTVTLPGSLQATLVHQPQADRATAAWRGVTAGSYHEPSRFHLGWRTCWRHLLFYGGERYQDDDRLMELGLAPGRKRESATTLARHSAFFFEVAATMLWLMVSRVYRRCCRPRCCSGKIFSAKWR
ncbi:insulinase family protein [Klebsiella pneumoniae]|nr:insulinase family protein [Klebsiella pneumoniae]